MLTTIRPLAAGELRSFAQFAACFDRGFAPSTALEFETWLQSLWQSGQSAPDCCFLAERDGQPLGAIVYWLRGDSAHLEHVRAPAGEASLLDQLLLESLAQMRDRGTRRVWVELLTPPMDAIQRAMLSACLERIGFGPSRERLTFICKNLSSAVLQPDRLSFRSLAELGPQPFIAAWAEMTADTLDSGIAADRAQKGPAAYATDAFADEALTRHEPEWWEIAYDTGGAAVGMVLAGIVGRQPAVLFVAVSPSHRGKHFARDLLARGIATLKRAGAASVRGDVDVANVPMIRAFESVGFSAVRSCRLYERELPCRGITEQEFGVNPTPLSGNPPRLLFV
jgi:ribosomal protein S18 acetylase RimI-like enzyme